MLFGFYLCFFILLERNGQCGSFCCVQIALLFPSISLDETSMDGLMDYSTLGMAFDIIHPGASHDSPRSSVLQSRTSCIRVDRTTATSPVAGSKYSSAEDRRSDG